MSTPKVAVRAIVQNALGEVLLLKRASHETGGGRWCLPGGKLELGESGEEAVARELYEEVGLRAVSVHLLFTQDSPAVGPDEQHYMNLYFEVSVEGKPELKDNDVAWAWVGLYDLGRYRIAFRNDDALKRYFHMAARRVRGESP